MRRWDDGNSGPASSARRTRWPRWLRWLAVLLLAGNSAAWPSHRLALTLASGSSAWSRWCHGRADHSLGVCTTPGDRGNARRGSGIYSGRAAHGMDSELGEEAWLSIFRTRLFRFDGFFNLHVVELLGVKDFATFQALNKFGVFVPGDDTYSRVFADRCVIFFRIRLDSGIFPNGCMGIHDA